MEVGNKPSTELIINRLKRYLKDMDARIAIENVEIREKLAAVGQLEKEKLELELEINKIEELIRDK